MHRPRLHRSAPAIALAALAAACAGRAFADVPDAAAALNAGDCKAAGAAINRGLERKDPQAYFFAGFLFDATGCVEPDPARATRYYRQAAELGSAEGADALALAYGLGRGVERDYAEAYRWFGAAGGPGAAPAAAVADARLAGYVATLSHVALGRVRYPTDLERAGIESSFDVVFVPATGDFSVRNLRTAVEVGSNVPRSRQFVELVRGAYRDAAAGLPPPDGARAADAFVTPWRFAMRRGRFDERLAQGGITVGTTMPAGRAP